jgi:uncharacterized protein (TIGR02145 family)
MKKMFFLMLVFFLGISAGTNAQVTIGSDNLPHSGAVLDLQSDNLGLKLPNVALDDLMVFGLPVTAPSTAANAKGMYVYNTNSDIGEGVYVWDGGQWILVKAAIGTPIEQIYISSPTGSQLILSNESVQLSLAVTPVGAETSLPTMKWGVDNGTGIASITNDGILTGREPGTVSVTVTRPDGVIGKKLFYVVAHPLETQKIVAGSREYETYNFGGDVWFVENSREGLPHKTCYEDDAAKCKGYYYDRDKTYMGTAANERACPTGWHAPTLAEANRLVDYLYSQGRVDGSASLFRNYDTYTGEYSSYSDKWWDWELAGYFWINPAATGEQPNRLWMSTLRFDVEKVDTSYWKLPVRCVKDHS